MPHGAQRPHQIPRRIIPRDGPRKPANMSQILRRTRLDKGPARTKRKWKGVRVRILRLIPISPPPNRAREDRFPRPIAYAFTSYRGRRLAASFSPSQSEELVLGRGTISEPRRANQDNPRHRWIELQFLDQPRPRMSSLSRRGANK